MPSMEERFMRPQQRKPPRLAPVLVAVRHGGILLGVVPVAIGIAIAVLTF
jgi:hypothetical protein